ncbi:putative gustatory receptor clone PTE03 [Neoarius graeffei]|uniref:putative gustatory receptor clone PTE03 n=1 Tax=Neoarius graeffei TaxID=443677 RepID=UPI00298C94D8|nr:putative gustatory receptor clone PTE03 [Neoarius graeffei]
MDYSINFTYFTLGGHVDLQHYKYVYFMITLKAYIMIVCFNTVIISVICRNKCLHEPMYIFIAALLCNSLFGSTAFYPKLLIDLLSETQIVSHEACVFQAFCMYTYAVSEFLLLSAMAFDRYMSICKPLHYATIVKMHIVRKLIFFSCFFSCCTVGVGALLASQHQLCKFKLNRLYCDLYSIVKLGCTRPTVYNLYGLVIASIAVFPPVIFIIYSYIRILSVCLKNSKDFRRKALQTCLPHILVFIIFSVNICFEIINHRLESNQIPHIITMIMSVNYALIPPLFNPIIYGIKMQGIFDSIRRLISWKRRTQISF